MYAIVYSILTWIRFLGNTKKIDDHYESIIAEAAAAFDELEKGIEDLEALAKEAQEQKDHKDALALFNSRV